jgi:hypothetical protein
MRIIEIGASRGGSATWSNKYCQDGHDVLLIEGDPTKAKELKEHYKDHPTVSVVEAIVTPDNVHDLIKGPGIDVLSLDIDGYDWHVLKAVLNDYRPIELHLELNEKIPPNVWFSVKYRPDYWWDGSHFYGMSLRACMELLQDHWYGITDTKYQDITARIGGSMKAEDVQYRLSRFCESQHYNKDVEYWMTSQDPVKDITAWFEKHGHKREEFECRR